MNYDEDEDDWRRKPFGDIFGFTDFEQEFERMKKLADEMLKKGMSRNMDSDPFVYGFSVKTGPDGKPKIQEFGNAKDYFKHGDKERTEWTPLTNVQETDGQVMVTVDLPGVNKEDIDLEVRERSMVIDVQGERRYKTEVDLPSSVDPREADASYNNGILEVKLKKEKEEKGQSIEIS